MCIIEHALSRLDARYGRGPVGGGRNQRHRKLAVCVRGRLALAVQTGSVAGPFLITASTSGSEKRLLQRWCRA